MTTQIPTQCSTTIELTGSIFRRVLICFTPAIRAGCDPEFDWSYISFVFTPRNSFEKPVEHYFLPRKRWHAGHHEEWAKVMAMLPESIDMVRLFEQTTVDLVL
jgi:hypothetical protein